MRFAGKQCEASMLARWESTFVMCDVMCVDNNRLTSCAMSVFAVEEKQEGQAWQRQCQPAGARQQ